ncbi:MAG: phage tail assembly chaperone [Sphingomonadaceae bacterium]
MSLGWRADEFWAATPDELVVIFEALLAPLPAPIDLRAIMEAFPDG